MTVFSLRCPRELVGSQCQNGSLQKNYADNAATSVATSPTATAALGDSQVVRLLWVILYLAPSEKHVALQVSLCFPQSCGLKYFKLANFRLKQRLKLSAEQPLNEAI